MELYAQHITYDLIDGMVCFVATVDDTEYDWHVPVIELFALGITPSVNLIVDTFRKTHNKLGL